MAKILLLLSIRYARCSHHKSLIRAGKNLLGENCPLHLHAREISFFGASKKLITIKAPLPPHMSHTFDLMGWRIPEIEKTELSLGSGEKQI